MTMEWWKKFRARYICSDPHNESLQDFQVRRKRLKRFNNRFTGFITAIGMIVALRFMNLNLSGFIVPLGLNCLVIITCVDGWVIDLTQPGWRAQQEEGAKP